VLFVQQRCSGACWLPAGAGARTSGRSLFPPGRFIGRTRGRYAGEFYHYSAPLLAYAACGSAALLAERWLLQWFHGAAEQGFFGLSYQISSICILFTSAMTPLLTREFARAHAASDQATIQRLFSRYIPALYSAAAFLSLFLFVHADTVTSLSWQSFTTAKAAVAVWCSIPCTKPWPLSGAVFYPRATALYRNILL